MQRLPIGGVCSRGAVKQLKSLDMELLRAMTSSLWPESYLESALYRRQDIRMTHSCMERSGHQWDLMCYCDKAITECVRKCHVQSIACKVNGITTALCLWDSGFVCTHGSWPQVCLFRFWKLFTPQALSCHVENMLTYVSLKASWLFCPQMLGIFIGKWYHVHCGQHLGTELFFQKILGIFIGK